MGSLPSTRDLRVRACPTLADAVLFTTSPLLMNESDRAAFRKVEAAVRLSRYGGDCYAYCMLAAGLIDLVIETELKPYDVLPLVPIITGAGGIVTTWENGPPVSGGRIVAAGDRRVHAAVLEMLNKSG
jgi:myo-inositol-1(or 4)-monophosphatase